MVNGEVIAFGGGRFQGVLSDRLMPGETANLSVTVPEGEITATLTVPSAATISSPLEGAVLAAGSATIDWTIAANPSGFRGGVSLDPYDSSFAPSFNVLGSERTTTIAAIPAGKSASAYVTAYNKTEVFTGPIALGSVATAEYSEPASSIRFTTAP